MDESSIRYVLDRSAERARVPRSSPHDWRHTFVGDRLDAGADLATIQPRRPRAAHHDPALRPAG
jgi:integrase